MRASLSPLLPALPLDLKVASELSPFHLSLKSFISSAFCPQSSAIFYPLFIVFFTTFLTGYGTKPIVIFPEI